jgi:hypothetical protein
VDVPLQEDFVPFIRLLLAFFYVLIFSNWIPTVGVDLRTNAVMIEWGVYGRSVELTV